MSNANSVLLSLDKFEELKKLYSEKRFELPSYSKSSKMFIFTRHEKFSFKCNDCRSIQRQCRKKLTPDEYSKFLIVSI